MLNVYAQSGGRPNTGANATTPRLRRAGGAPGTRGGRGRTIAATRRVGR